MICLIEVKTGKEVFMALPEYSLKQLLEAGVHFGHQTHRWNPLMEEYIYGVRNGIHIIDLTQTFTLLDVALNAVHNTVAKGGSILFVGTKRQAQKSISEAAERSAQYYMNHRWLGGTLTNWKTVSNSISRLKKLDEQLSDGATGLTKKERLNLEREQSKLNASLGGIREMGGLPDLIFVIDSNRESLAIQEARNLKIPVIAILDTNSDPTKIDFPIPGNDDAARSITLYCDLIAKAALAGMTNQLAAAGVDIGESIDSSEEEPLPLNTEDNGDQLENRVSEVSQVKSSELLENNSSSISLEGNASKLGSINDLEKNSTDLSTVVDTDTADLDSSTVVNRSEEESEVQNQNKKTAQNEKKARESEVVSNSKINDGEVEKVSKKPSDKSKNDLNTKPEKEKPLKKPVSPREKLTGEEKSVKADKKD